ncbi:MAG TPA: hypothetical protein VN723_13165 [Rhizomicrobium sp.]|jgi:hypothetical protein|nr:hypothetical protein [Rhizomicrobium sp.]
MKFGIAEPDIESEVATRIFRVRRLASGYYEVRDDYGSLLGTTGDEAKALHHAQCSAQFFREQGFAARVLVKRGEEFVEPELMPA